MARITTTIVVLLLLANGTVTVMSGSGLTEDLGVELAPGISDSMDDLVSSMKEGFDPDVNVVESFVSIAIAASKTFKIIISGLFAAPTMFMNLGFPDWIVVPLFAPAYLLSTLELAFLAAGRRK